MKRGFLLKAAAKKAAADKRASAKPKGPPGHPQTPSTANVPPLPTSATDGQLTEHEKALPKDHDKNNASVLPFGRDITERKESASDSAPQAQIVVSTMPHIYDGDGSTQWITHSTDPMDEVLKTPGYPSRVPKPRRPDLYEVRMTPKMGQGVFAKHDIKRGELILAERPLLISPNWEIIDVAQNSNTGLGQLWKAMANEYEKRMGLAFERMDEEGKATYMSLWNSHKSDGSGPLFGIRRTNAFAATDLTCVGDGSIMPQIYGGVCNIGSRFNHSCMPNLYASFNVASFAYRFRAVRDIRAGEQLFGAYCDLRKTKAERQASLASYEMSCDCPACANATAATDTFRQTFVAELSRLHAQIFRPELKSTDIADLLSSLKQLETQMVAEGLEAQIDSFIKLLTSIRLGLLRLGSDREAVGKYENRLEDFYNMRSFKKPFRTWLNGC